MFEALWLAVDASGESSYARGSFDMFEESLEGIAFARADRTFLLFMIGLMSRSLLQAGTRMGKR